MSQTTITERTELAQELAPLVKSLLAKESKNVADVELVESTDGVSTLPAIYSAGGIKKVVRIATDTIVSEAASDVESTVAPTIAKCVEQTAACKTQTDSAAEAEAARKDAEASRVEVEASRAEAEASRVKVESARAEAEASRVTAEKSRESTAKATKEACDAATQNATQATAASKEQTETAKGYNEHPPKIGDNGNWWTWNGTQYADTTVPSRGDTLYPTLSHEGNKLYITDTGGTVSQYVKQEGNKLVFDIYN